MEQLSDELFCVILCAELCIEDVLRFSRVSHRCYQAVKTCSEVWQKLYLESYGAPAGVTAANLDWRVALKNKSLEEAAERRHQRRVKLLKLQGKLQIALRSTRELQQELRQEQHITQSSKAELMQIKKSRLAARGAMCWAPSAVHQHFQQVTAQNPIEAEWREREWEQALKVSSHRVQCLRNSLRARKQEVAVLSSKISLLQG